jgi:hypothetical protein
MYIVVPAKATHTAIMVRFLEIHAVVFSRRPCGGGGGRVK